MKKEPYDIAVIGTIKWTSDGVIIIPEKAIEAEAGTKVKIIAPRPKLTRSRTKTHDAPGC